MTNYVSAFVPTTTTMLVVVVTVTLLGCITANSSMCPSSIMGLALEDKYHSDNSCDIEEYQSHKEYMRYRRSLKYNFLLRPMGTVQHLPNRQTRSCPMQPPSIQVNTNWLKNVQVNHGMGMDTMWIVENHASTPIVVSWMNPRDGKEYSASNNAIYPAIADPNAIVQPGSHLIIDTYEGHIFTARSILVSTPSGSNTSNILVGPVLLSHTVGLIPIGNPDDHYECSDAIASSTQNTASTNELQQDQESLLQLDEEIMEAVDYDDENGEKVYACNTIEVGFRNRINCPVTGYFVHAGENDDDNVCMEQERFQLGTQTVGLSDFMEDASSATKYESTFLGHTFRFRLTSNPSVVVDTITLQPTIVQDCPALTSAATTGVTSAVPISVSGLIDSMNQPIHNNNMTAAEQEKEEESYSFVITNESDVIVLNGGSMNNIIMTPTAV